MLLPFKNSIRGFLYVMIDFTLYFSFHTYLMGAAFELI